MSQVKLGLVNECNSCVDLISCCLWHDSVRGSRSVGRASEPARIPTNKRAKREPLIVSQDSAACGPYQKLLPMQHLGPGLPQSKD